MIFKPSSDPHLSILKTPRLNIREFTSGDAAFLRELMNQPEWIQFIGNQDVKSLEDAEKTIKEKYVNIYQTSGYGLYLVERKHTQEPLGMCGFVKRAYLEYEDLGFAFLKRYCSQGFGYESARALVEYGLTQLKFKEILAITIAENKASIRLLEKLSFQFKAPITKPDGEELSLYQYQRQPLNSSSNTINTSFY